MLQSGLREELLPSIQTHLGRATLLGHLGAPPPPPLLAVLPVRAVPLRLPLLDRLKEGHECGPRLAAPPRPPPPHQRLDLGRRDALFQREPARPELEATMKTGVNQSKLRESYGRVWRCPFDMIRRRRGRATYPKLTAKKQEMSAAEQFERELLLERIRTWILVAATSSGDERSSVRMYAARRSRSDGPRLEGTRRMPGRAAGGSRGRKGGPGPRSSSPAKAG